jgi:hypothetical protein
MICEDLSKKYGHLTVVIVFWIPGKNTGRKHLCRCDCGNYVNVDIRKLHNGHTKTCGCLNKEIITKHSLCGTPAYRTWQKMKQRCYNKNHEHYNDYGGRGITVCERWLNSFENFYKDMGTKPSPKHSIERINNNGDYELSNCRWATTKEQRRNTRQTINVTFNGKTQCLSDWAKDLGFNVNTLYSRINVHGWSVEKTLTTPVKNK